MTFDVEQTAREFRRWFIANNPMANMGVEVWFTAWADERGLSADQQRAVRRESDLLEAVEE